MADQPPVIPEDSTGDAKLSVEETVAKTRESLRERRRRMLEGKAPLTRRSSKRVSRRLSHVRRAQNLQKTSSVVLDIGEVYTKCGFAGDTRPRHIISNDFRTSDGRKFEGVFSRGTHHIDLSSWLQVMTRFLNVIYFEKLQVSPKDRKVVIVEGPFLPYLFKLALVKTLLEMEAPGVMFMNGSHLPMFACGVKHGVIVDCGYGDTRIFPVSHGYGSVQGRTSVPVGMRDVHKRFKDLYVSDQKESKEEKEDLLGRLTHSVTENMIARLCFVREMKEPTLESLQGAMFYQIDRDTRVVIPEKCRSLAADALFGATDEGHNIATAILDAALACPVDVRPVLCHNIILAGGTTMLPGFGRRLLDEINTQIQQPKYEPIIALANKFNLPTSPFPNNIKSWIGGSLVASLEIPVSEFLTKETWKTKKVVVTTLQQIGDDRSVKRQMQRKVKEPCGLVPDWTMFPAPHVEEEEDYQTF